MLAPLLPGGICSSTRKTAENIEDTSKNLKKTTAAVRRIFEAIADAVVTVTPYAVPALLTLLYGRARGRANQPLVPRIHFRKGGKGDDPHAR